MLEELIVLLNISKKYFYENCILYLQLVELFSNKNVNLEQDPRNPPNISPFLSLQLVDVMEEYLLVNCDLIFTTVLITHSQSQPFYIQMV